MGRQEPTVVSIVGARPQLIKLAALLRRLDQAFGSRIVHTGQHYDREMSADFFTEYRLRPPDINLNVGPASPNRQLARMIDRLDGYFTRQKPHAVLVFGDTTTTMAGAVAAAMRNIPVGHVEAGLRSFDLRMAEERNRVVADHLSAWLFCPTREALGNLRRENVGGTVVPVGDVMAETFRVPRRPPILSCPACGGASTPLRHNTWIPAFAGMTEKRAAFGTTSSFLPIKGRQECPANRRKEKYYFVTVHRAEAVDDPDNLAALVEMLAALDRPAVFPVHPRTRKNLRKFGLLGRLRRNKQLYLLPPVDHRSALWLIAHARAVITDSGGVQKEAYWAGVRCLTLRTVTEWGLLVEAGWNELVGLSARKLSLALRSPLRPRRVRDPIFARTDASAAIVRRLRADLR